MSQDDLNVLNASGAVVRGKINTALAAIATRQSGPSPPSPSYPNQDWADTGTNTAWRRNNANSAWINVGSLDQALLLATDVDIMGGTENTKAVTSATAADLWKKGVSIPSAATLAFTGTVGQFFHVTGTTTINGIGGRTNGPPLVLAFDGVLTLTHSATFKLPGAANIVTAAGDTARFVNDGADNWVCVSYTLATGSAIGAPIGTVSDFAGSTAPTGWIFCYGQNVSRTTYALLFAVIGTSYGAGDGSTTFAVPDCRGRTVFGKDDMGGTAAARLNGAYAGGINGATLGGVGGEQGHVLAAAEMPVHTHGLSDPGHAHSLYDPGHTHSGSMTATSGIKGLTGVGGGSVAPSGSATYTITDITGSVSIAAAGTGMGVYAAGTGMGIGNAGSGGGHNVVPPGIVFNKIIRTGV